MRFAVPLTLLLFIVAIHQNDAFVPAEETNQHYTIGRSSTWDTVYFLRALDVAEKRADQLWSCIAYSQLDLELQKLMNLKFTIQESHTGLHYKKNTDYFQSSVNDQEMAIFKLICQLFRLTAEDLEMDEYDFNVWNGGMGHCDGPKICPNFRSDYIIKNRIEMLKKTEEEFVVPFPGAAENDLRM